MESIGFLLVALALAFAAFVATASASLRDTMPRRFTIFSLATAVILLGTHAVQVPIVLMPIWPPSPASCSYAVSSPHSRAANDAHRRPRSTVNSERF